MRLPENQQRREAVYRNKKRECEKSRQERKARYRRLRMWYLNGSDLGDSARYNKIKEHVAFSASMMYLPGLVRFGVELPQHYGPEWIEECEAAREELQQLWRGENSLIYYRGVHKAHYCDTAVFKTIVSDNQAHLTLLPDTGDIGLLNEANDDWDAQDAICQWYTVDLPTFFRMCRAKYPGDDETSQKKCRELYEQGKEHAIPGYESTNETLPATMQRIILASASPQMIGAAQGDTFTMLAIPQVSEPVVRLSEMWIKDDEAGDYRVVTILEATEEVLWDPINPLLSGSHPFHPLTLGPIEGYAWGIAPIEDLLQLQNWREDKMNKVDERDNLQLNPPIFFEGMGNTIDGEKAKAFRRPGGNLSSAMPNAKATPMTPQPLPEPFAMVDHIDGMFAKAGGLPKGIGGMGNEGARTGEQAMTQAMLTGGPTMGHAMLVESNLEGVATHMLRLHRRVLARTLKKSPQGKEQTAQEFLLSQMPGDFVARVWAHSASPLYMQQMIAKAKLAKEAGAIDNEDFLEFLDLPMTRTKLVTKAKALAAAQAERQAEVLQIQKVKALKK